jgi:predicted PurR-regulated permease PerM
MFIGVTIVSLLSSFGLWLIDLPFPIIIGVFAGVSNLIPYAGPVVGIASAFVAAAMTGSPSEMYISIVIVFAIVQIIDNALVSPIVMAKSSNLHPLGVLFLVIFGSTFGGVVGMFLIVPVVSLCRVAFVTLWAELTRPPRPDFSSFRDVDTHPSCA